jgi:hypothetical protein
VSMATHKPFQLSVTLGATEIRFPNARTAEICRDEKIFLFQEIQEGKKKFKAKSFGYRFIKYSGDLYSVDRKGIHLEQIANEVLGLITPARKLSVEEKKFLGVTKDNSGWLSYSDLDPEQIPDFLSTYGMVGLANYDRRNALNQVRTPREFISKVGISPKYLPVLEKEFKEDATSLPRRISRIVRGDEIPFKWIEEDLRTLAKCIRMIVAIDQAEDEWWNTGRISLSHSKSLRRMVHAWKPIFEIPDYKDSGDFMPLDPLWIQDKPERMLQDFISAINNFLLPMTRNAVLTDRTREIQEENFGLETALISYLFLNKTGRLFQRICENPRCGLLFFPKRETRVFCDPQCATNVRVARSRAKKKKVSATKAGKKKNEKVVKNGK